LPSRFPPEHERKRSRKYECGHTHPQGNNETVHDDFPPEKEAEKMRKRKNRKYHGGNSRKWFHVLSLVKCQQVCFA
jgi:hypothetical protein